MPALAIFQTPRVEEQRPTAYRSGDSSLYIGSHLRRGGWPSWHTGLIMTLQKGSHVLRDYWVLAHVLVPEVERV